MSHIRLTAAQALVRYMINQKVPGKNGQLDPLFAGVWAIFGHGNVAGIGEALYGAKEELPTYRGHNEQTMAHAALAYSKSTFRRQVMAVTSSIGPGATNMVTAAALAHVNRLPILFLPGDVFANRRPDPVLQQIEDFSDSTITANDTFRPVSKYFDRITRPEQLLNSLPRAMSVLTDNAECGPVTLAFCQDVQTEAYDFPLEFFNEKVWHKRRPAPDLQELYQSIQLLKNAKKPLIIAGGGVLYSDAAEQLSEFSSRFKIPVAETQAGKGCLNWDHKQNVGSIGVTGTQAANTLARNSDVILAIGTRLQDFTSGSRTLFENPDRKIIQLNVSSFDGTKHHAQPLVCDALVGLEMLSDGLENYQTSEQWNDQVHELSHKWNETIALVTTPDDSKLPTDAQVVGAVNNTLGQNGVVVCAAGGLPGELHKLWLSKKIGSYHMEYGYSCMGYEIAAGLGVKMANPDREVVVMVGDGSYMMANSEIATAVMLGEKITLVILDNRGFGCINRLQQGCGGKPFNNLLDDSKHELPSNIDFCAHAESMGAIAEKVTTISELKQALERAKASDVTNAIVIDTDPHITTQDGGNWWDVAVPEVSEQETVREARTKYEQAIKKQRLGD